MRFAFLLWLTYAYFIPSPSWNPNSRFDLTLAVVEHGQLSIDPYHHNTGDKSVHRGRTYSDKAPGVSFLAVPSYALFRAIWHLAGGDDPAVMAVGRDGKMDPALVNGDGEDDVLLNAAYRWGQHWSSVFTAGLAAAILGGLFLELCARRGLGRQEATGMAMSLCLGTLIFPYATTFYGHVVAACFGFAAFFVLKLEDPLANGGRRLAAAGALAGMATACEWPAAILVVALGLWLAQATGWRRIGRLWPFVVGASAPVALALVYNAAAFGSPWQLGYAHVSRAAFAQGMGQGIMGVSWPRPGAFFALLFGRERGLFFTSPILLLALWGLLRHRWLPERRRLTWLALGVTLAFVLLSAGYYMWWGGLALGPRHVVPAIPFLALGLFHAFPVNQPLTQSTRKQQWHQQVTFGLLSLSIVNMTLGTAVGPEAPLTGDVLFRYVYPMAATGRIPAAPGASNFGRLLGLPGILSLLPLAALWLAFISRVWPLLPAQPSSPPTSSASSGSGTHE